VSERRQHENIVVSSMPELSITRPCCLVSQTLPSIAAENADTYDSCSTMDITNWWKGDNAMTSNPHHQLSPNSELRVAECLKLSDTVSCKQSSSNSPPLQQCKPWPDDNVNKSLLETDGDFEILDDDHDNLSNVICKRSVAEQDNEVSNRPQKSPRRSDVVHEQLQQSTDLSTPRSLQTWKIIVFEEKLCLLEKMIAAGSVDFPCRMQVIHAENAVELVAPVDSVTESELRLYELIANFSTISLHLPAGVVKLLMSTRGQEWLKRQLESLSAIFHAKDSSCPFVIGASTMMSMDAKFLLETALSIKRIPFNDEHVTFLRSTKWAVTVEKFEFEYFAVVSTEYHKSNIVVEGSVDALNDIGDSVEMLLKQNSRVQRKINMSAEQFQLLMNFRVEIHDKMKAETSQDQQNRY